MMNLKIEVLFMILKSYKLYICFFYILCFFLLIVSAFFDLNINVLLNNPNSVLAIWIRNTGEIPARLILPLSGTCLFYICEKWTSKIFGISICFGGSIFLGYKIAKYFYVEENQIAFGVLTGVSIAIVLIFIGKYITFPKKVKNILIIISLCTIVGFFFENVIVEILKILWGRVRFRDLLQESDFTSFSAWYIPNGINGNKSFPSGHVAGAGLSFYMLLLPYISPHWKNRTAICFIIPFVYTAIVSFTRIVMGAHYLSDVTFGAIISFTIVLITLFTIEKYLKKSSF